MNQVGKVRAECNKSICDTRALLLLVECQRRGIQTCHCICTDSTQHVMLRFVKRGVWRAVCVAPAVQQLWKQVGEADNVPEAPPHTEAAPAEVRQAGGGDHLIGDIRLL
jgi:hypothetical protein